MSHPVFRLVTEQPMLLANHVGDLDVLKEAIHLAREHVE